MPVYRYKSTQIDQATLQTFVPGAPTVGAAPGPDTYVDITVASGSKTDLDDYMATQGYAYLSTDPTTPARELAATWDIPLVLAGIAEPAAPAIDTIKVYAGNWARWWPTVRLEDGSDYQLQAGMADIAPSIVLPGSGSTPTTLGTDITITGTASHPTLSNTNRLTQSRRIRLESASSAGSSAGLRSNQTVCWRSNIAGLGGFYFGVHFAMSTNVAGQRLFVGLRASTSSISSVDPSSLTDIVGVGFDTGDANLQVMRNDGSGTATKIDLGASFARSTTDVYEIHFWAAPNSSEIEYVVENEVADVVASGTLSTNLPTNDSFLGYYVWTNNNATASLCRVELSNLYLEASA